MPARRRLPALAATAALLAAVAMALAAACGSDPSSAGSRASDGARGASDGAPRRASTVALIVLENRERGAVIGNPEAPFINRLARRWALAQRYFAVSHPSLPNYLALLGGSTFGIASDCSDCSARGPSLASQLSRAGISWRAYMEGMPRPCFRGDRAGRYVRRHDPFMYFPSIAAVPARCFRVVPARLLERDIRRRRLPAFAWIEPDLCHGGHDCPLGVVDSYLSRLLPRLLPRLGPNGLLVLTFDEGSSDRGPHGRPGGGRVATIVAGPRARRGARPRAAYDHYSLLATFEDALGLPRLRAARRARSLKAMFER
jgi:hypothetical protein